VGPNEECLSRTPMKPPDELTTLELKKTRKGLIEGEDLGRAGEKHGGSLKKVRPPVGRKKLPSLTKGEGKKLNPVRGPTKSN